MHIELAVQSSDSNQLTQLSGSTSRPKPWTPSKMFPVLVLLLMLCYGIMAMVLVEQGGVIQSQRNLIQQLSQDSSQLLALKSQELTQRAIEKQQAEQAAKAVPHTTPKVCKSCGNHLHTNRTRQPEVDKQPLQTADRVDGRRLPSKI